MGLSTARRAAVLGLAVLGCGRVADHTARNGDPHPGSGADGSVGDPNTVLLVTGANVEKIDVLLVLENSRSMADKEGVLRDAVPDLVRRLISPPCIDPVTRVPDYAATPADPKARCPRGTSREFTPVRNIHVGVITSSLGGDACQGADGAGLEQEEADDHAHLVGSRPRFAAALTAAPGARALDPAGFAAFDWSDGDVPSFMESVRAMTVAAGEFGCRVASPLEAAYRFLVHPAPNDDELLSERQAFLRQDSLLVVVVIADRSDESGPGNGTMYPTERYVNAFSKPELCTSRTHLDTVSEDCPDRNGDGRPDILPNPIFQTDGDVPRDPSLVYLVGILGVPWQDIQAQTDETGRDYPQNELHFQSARQMVRGSAWTTILGSTGTRDALETPPTDALMAWSSAPRTGIDGESPPRSLAPPESVYLANPVNGHERLNPVGAELQYACIFQLPEPRDCAAIASGSVPRPSCDCDSNAIRNLNPLCQDASGAYTTNQHFAKAYPAVGELAVLRNFGENAVIGSLCARNLVDRQAQDYGYRAAFDAIAERLKVPRLAGRCVSTAIRSLPDPVDPSKVVAPCSVIYARPRREGVSECDQSEGQLDLSSDEAASARAELKAKGACDAHGTAPCAAYSVCRLQESDDGCHSVLETGEPTTPGWCFIDPEDDPRDDQEIAGKCPEGERHVVRFVDPQGVLPTGGARFLVTCTMPP